MSISAENALKFGLGMTPVFMSQVPESPQRRTLEIQLDSLQGSLQAEIIKKASKSKKGGLEGALKGAASGAAAGSAAGPWGALAGAVVGGAAGGFSETGGADAGQLAASFGNSFGGTKQGQDYFASPDNRTPTPGEPGYPYDPGFPTPKPNDPRVPAEISPALTTAPDPGFSRTGGNSMVGYAPPLVPSGEGGAAPVAPVAPTEPVVGDPALASSSATMDPAGGGSPTSGTPFGIGIDGDFNGEAALAAGAAGLGLAALGGVGRRKRNQVGDLVDAALQNDGPGNPRAQVTHPSGAMRMRKFAETSGRDLRTMFKNNPVQAELMIHSLYSNGVKLSRDQLRGIPRRYRKQLREQGVNIPEVGIERVGEFLLPMGAALAAGYLVQNDDGVEDFVANF